MRAVVKFLIQIGLIILVAWFIIKYTTLDDKLISFFRGTTATTSQSGTIVAIDPNICDTPWGVKLPNGSSVYAYRTDTPGGNGPCKEEVRTCHAGVLDGTYPYASCNTIVTIPDTGASQPTRGIGASCTTPWGETLNDGGYIIAYESVNSCRFEKRYCTNGALNGSYSSNYCNSPEGYSEEVAVQKAPTETIIPAVSYGYMAGVPNNNYQGPTVTSANGAVTVITSWNDNKTNPTSLSANDTIYHQPKPWAYTNYDLTQHGCTTPWGTLLSNNDRVIAYKSPTPARAGASCTYERRTCFQGTLGGSYTYPSCSLSDPEQISNNNGQDYYYPTTTTTNRSCTTPRGQTVKNGYRVLAYISSYASSSYACVGEYRTCNNGTLAGSYQYGSCSMQQNDYRCSLPRGGTIPQGSSVVAYGNSSSPCSSQVRTCQYGRLSGTYGYSSCQSDSYYQQSCTLPWGGTVPNGYTIQAYSSPYGSCMSQMRTCNNGYLAGSYQYSNCTNDNYNNNNYNNNDCGYYGCNNNYGYGRSCQLPWGGAIADGSSVTAYNSSSSPCASQTRTCNNGNLQGSYQYSSCNNYNGCGYNGCDNNNGRSCSLPRGGAIADGSSVTAYNSSSSPCSSERRTCNNGMLQGSYQYGSCNDYGNSCSLPRGGTIGNGGSVVAYSSANGPCNKETRTCNNGNLQGSYQYAACTEHTNTCTLPWGGTIADGAKVEAYQTTTAPCYKQIRSCNNGVLDGSFPYNYCDGTTNGGTDTYGSRQDAGMHEGNIDSLDSCNANATSPYICGSTSSNSCTDYQKLTCTSFSPMICNYQQRSVSCVQ